MRWLLALAATAVLAAPTTARADSGPAERVLTHFAEDDRETFAATRYGYAAVGGFFAVSGAVVLIGNDGDRDRRLAGGMMLGGGVAFAAGMLLTGFFRPRGEHEKLLARLRAGEALETVEREWRDRADSARTIRHWVGGVSFGFAAIAFGVGTASLLGDDHRSHVPLTAGALSFGFIFCALGGLSFAQTSTVESSWNGYRLARGDVALLPNLSVEPGGARAGVTLTF